MELLTVDTAIKRFNDHHAYCSTCRNWQVTGIVCPEGSTFLAEIEDAARRKAEANK